MATDVDLFVPCLTDTFHPRAAAATVAVLEHLGHRVHFPKDQTCCGQAHHNAGAHDDAAALARRMARIFSGERPVITPSGSCAAMVIEHAAGLVPPDDPDLDAMRSLARRTRELSQYLIHDLALDLRNLGARWPGGPTRCTWHFSCHLRGIGGSDETARILRAVGDLEVHSPDGLERCCGFGGAFAVDEPAISSAMGREKAQSLLDTEAEILVVGESGCALQIAGTLSRGHDRPIRMLHLAEVLAESWGLSIPGEDGDA